MSNEKLKVRLLCGSSWTDVTGGRHATLTSAEDGPAVSVTVYDRKGEQALEQGAYYEASLALVPQTCYALLRESGADVNTVVLQSNVAGGAELGMPAPLDLVAQQKNAGAARSFEVGSETASSSFDGLPGDGPHGHAPKPLTIADAKQELEAGLSIAVGSSDSRQVTMTVRDASGTHERTGTMDATRNEKGGIDYTVDVDPIDLTADAPGV